MRYSLRTQALSLLASLLASACAADGRTSEDTEGSAMIEGARVLPVQGFGTSGLAWLPDGRIVVTRSNPSGGPNVELWSMRPNGTSLKPLMRKNQPGCRFTDYLQPLALEDARLAYKAVCRRQFSPDRHRILGLNVATGESEEIASAPFPIAGFTWNPELRRGFVTNSQEICSGIAMITSEGIEERAIFVGEGDQRFRIDEDLRHPGPSGCRDWGLADWPAWSPDGRQIAFFASPQSVGIDGFQKAESPWNLYLMEADTLKPIVALSDIRFPRDPKWSPDGRWLAFGGEVSDGGEGVWLLAPGTGSLRKVTDFPVSWLAWSPDRSRMVVARPVRDDVFEHEFIVLQPDKALGDAS